MNLVIEPNGRILCIYGEVIDLASLGTPTISRASHVEPNENGRWLADMSPVRGPILGPYEKRSEALDAEVAWLEAHWVDHET